MRISMRSLGSQRHDAALTLPSVPGVEPDNPVLAAADAQIRWYDSNSQRSRIWHFRLRTLQLTFATAIPITQVPPAAVGWRVSAAMLGGLVALAQGIDTIHHYGDHYVAWRATCQRMLAERQLFAAEAGPYKDGKDLKLLAENLASIEGQEQQHWQQAQLADSGGGTSSTNR
jgi:hypothetical protein